MNEEGAIRPMSKLPRHIPGVTLPGLTQMGGMIGHAVNAIGSRIARGDWQEGGTIPREADLCAELKVSRSVLREACRVLAGKGMIRSRTSDGTRVLPRNNWRLLDPDVLQWRLDSGQTGPLLHDLLVARAALEPGAARLATASADDRHRAQVERAWQKRLALDDIARPRTAPSPEDFVAADLGFHKALLDATRSPLLMQLVPVIAAAITLICNREAPGIEPATSQRLHGAVVERFRKRDAHGAEAAMHDLIEWLTEQTAPDRTAA